MKLADCWTCRGTRVVKGPLYSEPCPTCIKAGRIDRRGECDHQRCDFARGQLEADGKRAPDGWCAEGSVQRKREHDGKGRA